MTSPSTAGRVTEAAIHRAVIHLPWPHKNLSPNARLHWRTKAKFVKAARQAACVLTKQAYGPRQWPPYLRPRLETVFCPPDHRRRDLDNLIASMKASNDGIGDALCVDDNKFIPSYRFGEVVKGGAVIVILESV